MTDKMTLLYIKGQHVMAKSDVAPGNVLAAISRAALPEESPPPAGATDDDKRDLELEQVGNLVGGELLVRSLLAKAGTTFTVSPVEFNIPFESFGLFTTDLDPNVLEDPRSHYVDEVEKKVKPLPGSTLANSAPDKVEFTGSDLVVTLLADVQADTGVWVVICANGASGPKNQVRYGVLKKDATDKKNKQLNAPGPLPVGSYSILTLVTGYQPTVFVDSVP